MSKKTSSNTFKDPHAKREAEKYDNPVASRELISQILAKSQGPLSHSALCNKLNIRAADQIEALRRRLIAMERDGQLVRNRKGAYGLIDKMDLVKGRVQGHRDGFGFLIPLEGEGDIFLSNRQMRKVFDGDEVLVRADGEGPNGKREGTIVEILAHNTHQTVGRFINDRGVQLVRPDSPRNCHDILIPPDDTAQAKDGQLVVVEIMQQPSRYQRPVGRVVEVLGDHLAPGMEIDVAIRSHGIPHIWPKAVEVQASEFTAEVKEQDKQNRIDLRDLPLVTIDGEDARDFDDAVYCEKKRSGGWRLYVAIADVSHYVSIGSALDDEATQRGTSVYFPDYVIPMLPQILSNGLCSLNPKVDRLCMVCEMTISAKGKISGYAFYEAVMHSHARLTYTQVGQMLAEKGQKHSALRDEYRDLVGHIDELNNMYQVLRAAREERGAIDFETKETKIVFDANRKIEKIVPVQRNDAHKIIEECMLAANVSTAKLLSSLKVPTLYRVHESPREEKLENLYLFLAEAGLSMRGGDEVTPQHYREVLAQAAGRPDAHIIQTVMLRSMNQAVYQPQNEGHFGLAYDAYAHFTSPIRRYPDLLVHRAIRALLQSNVKSTKLKRAGKAGLKPFAEVYPYTPAQMTDYGDRCSASERRADEATRDVVSWLKCEYLQSHVGETFDGVVSAVTGFGLFVELQDYYIDGLIHVATLPHDYYHFEAAKHRLVGERTRKVFRLGDGLKVQVMRVDLDERKIDFEFVARLPGANNDAKAVASSQDQPQRTVRKRKVAAVAETDSSAATTSTGKPAAKRGAAKSTRKKKKPASASKALKQEEAQSLPASSASVSADVAPTKTSKKPKKSTKKNDKKSAKKSAKKDSKKTGKSREKSAASKTKKGDGIAAKAAAKAEKKAKAKKPAKRADASADSKAASNSHSEAKVKPKSATKPKSKTKSKSKVKATSSSAKNKGGSKTAHASKAKPKKTDSTKKAKPKTGKSKAKQAKS